MVVVMRAAQFWQDAGGERLLDAGQAYDLPDVVALSLVSSGLAARVMAPPEIQSPVPVFETKRQRGRRA